jgi:hypothetical protein
MKRTFTLFIFSLLVFKKLSAQNSFTNYNTTNTTVFTSNSFTAIGIDTNGYIWAGTQYQGLYIFSPVTQTWIKSTDLTNVFINDIQPDNKGGTWISQSGETGLIGGGSSIAGGINYYSGASSSTTFYSVTSPGGLASRAVKSIWIDTAYKNPSSSIQRVMAAEATFITSDNTSIGGVAIGLNVNPYYFTNITSGLQTAGTPSCLSIGGNQNECWVFAKQNFGRSQILRYQPLNNNGNFLGAYDYTNVSVLSSGFQANAIYFDGEGRQWIGLATGGVIVKDGSIWKSVNMSQVFASGTTVNNNAITGDNDGNIYIGTTNGLVEYTGGAVDSASSYDLYTTADSLPSNNITGIAADNKNGRILITTDNGITFWKQGGPINVQLVWDNSFPQPGVKPRGVAAEGVSRLYVKVKRGNDTVPAFKQVEVTIKSYDAANPTLTGRLRVADTAEINIYTNEASGGLVTQTSRTDSTSKGEYWFWYVSPSDFCTDSLGAYAQLAERRDTIKVNVVYSNNTKDSTYFGVRVVRPPLVLVHGLASGPSTWDSCVYNGNTPYVSGNLEKYKHALTMNGRGYFIENATRLLSGDLATNADKLNSLQGNIDALRQMGFAANQVDYLCHSMGGIMLRGAQGWLPNKFYANGNYMYNNYGNGFVHKLIFINTPHNSSPIADGVEEFVPLFNKLLNKWITLLYKYNPNLQQPFDFIVPVNTTDTIFTFHASPAVHDLQVSDATGGVDLPETKSIKNHLITGDVALTTNVVDSLVQYNNLVKLVNGLLRVARDYYPSPAKDTLTAYFDNNSTEVERMLFFMNWYSATKNFPGFTSSGDLIVPYASETARQPETLPNITKFYNSPGSVYDASHVTIIPRKDVGQRIFNLLNTNVNNNPLFSDDIPANTDPDPAPDVLQTSGTTQSRPASSNQPLNTNLVLGTPTDSVSTFFDTAKISIISPLRTGAVTYVDSTLTVKYKLKDTVGLAYVNIHFQDIDSFTRSRSASQQISITPGAEYTGNQILYALAVYDKSDGVEYHTDSITVPVSNLATPQGFRVNNNGDEIELSDSLLYYPQYQVLYNGVWQPLANNDPNISVTLNPSGIVNYSTTDYSFSAAQDGFAQAYISYKGYIDTVSYNSILPLAVTCIDKSIASGKFSNPAIWSKQNVPGLCDSVIIDTNYIVIVDTSLQTSSIRINKGGTLTFNDTTKILNIGAADDGSLMLDNYGTLNMNGKLVIKGRLKLNPSSTFNMAGGLLTIDGNTGFAETSLPNGLYLFDVSSSMQSFSFTGGTLLITDPPLGANSQAINCSYIFGTSSVLRFGDGISTTLSNNPNGFGGNLLPSQVGNFILDAGTLANNRLFINLSPLTVKQSLQVKSGHLVQSAPLSVTQ